MKKRRNELLKELSSVHDVDDGVVIRFFTQWDNCEDNTAIKYKKIVNVDESDESVVFFYTPQNALFDLKQRFYIGCITCLNGKIQITTKDKNRILENGMKFCINSDEVQGLALENTYLITISNRKLRSEKTVEHVQANY